MGITSSTRLLHQAGLQKECRGRIGPTSWAMVQDNVTGLIWEVEEQGRGEALR